MELLTDTEKRTAETSIECAACKLIYAADDCDRPTRCPHCSAFICECCEVMRCAVGHHECPLCHKSLGSCKPATTD